MRILVHAKTRARSCAVLETAPGVFVVRVVESPTDGRANRAVIEALSGYFGVAKSCVTLVSGASAREKVFNIAV